MTIQTGFYGLVREITKSSINRVTNHVVLCRKKTGRKDSIHGRREGETWCYRVGSRGNID